MRLSLRRTSQFLAIGLFSLTLWVFIRASAPLKPDYVVPVYTGLTATSVVLFVLSFFVLRLGSGGSQTYWQSVGSGQAKRVAMVIAITIVSQLVLGFGFDLLFDFKPAFSFAFEHFLAWTLIPAACVWFGVITWPRRIHKATPVAHLAAGVPAILFAGAVGYNNYLGPNGAYVSMLEPLSLRLGLLVWAVATEEVVFRLFLLTAFLSLPISRFPAVFISGIAFAGMHAPLYLANSLFHADWHQLVFSASVYAPAFLGQAVTGLVLGLVWLRTGSFMLVFVSHAVINLGSAISPNL